MEEIAQLLPREVCLLRFIQFHSEQGLVLRNEKPEASGVRARVAEVTTFPFAWPVVEEWVHRLREMRLLGYGSSDAKGGFGAVYLRDLGFMLVRWTLRDEQPPSGPRDQSAVRGEVG